MAMAASPWGSRLVTMISRNCVKRSKSGPSQARVASVLSGGVTVLLG
jgi:hypothetical protein